MGDAFVPPVSLPDICSIDRTHSSADNKPNITTHCTADIVADSKTHVGSLQLPYCSAHLGAFQHPLHPTNVAAHNQSYRATKR